MRSILIAAAIAAGPVFADSEARQGSDWVRITANPCSNKEVLEHIGKAGEDHLDYRAAMAHIGGKDYTACWRPIFGQKTVFLRYSDGDAGLVPFADLKPVKSV